MCYLLTILLFFVFIVSHAQQRFSFARQKLGTAFTIVTYGENENSVNSIIEAVYDEVDRLNMIFSDYMDSSELNRLNARSGSGEYVKVSAELFDILSKAKQASLLSDGAFDVTIGPLSHLWRRARKTNTFPSKKEIRRAKRKTGNRYLLLDSEHQAVRLKKKNMIIDLGGIAKGYIAQKAMDLLDSAGLPSSLIDAGGDMIAGSPPPDKEGWTIGISSPDSPNQSAGSPLIVSHTAIATSGDAFQYLDYKGKRYSHIINPKTGMGVTFHHNVTVICAEGTTADWIASACSVMPSDKLRLFLASMPDIAVMINEKTGPKPIKTYFNGFENYLKNDP